MGNETLDPVSDKPVYRTVKTSRLFEQIVQQVEASILAGQLKPGDQLPAERDLAQRFGVSRTAVREAVKTLREKGLVEAYSGRGTFVTNGTSQAIRQSLDLMIRINQQEGSANLAELRQVLEPEIAGLAASRIEDQLLSTMREAVAVMDRNLHDPEAYVEADLDFHLALAEAAGNPLILSLLDSIVGLLREQRSRIFSVDGGPERGQFHHKRILAAVEKRDPEAARETMRAHLSQVLADSSASVQSGLPSVGRSKANL
jgi:GntR family transcriptional regulator, transcriptional repressor for pyruvate dehydrogenase complex